MFLVCALLGSAACVRKSPMSPPGGAIPPDTGGCPTAQLAGAWDECPTWSPDGRSIAFVHAARSASDSLAIYIVSAKDGTPKKIVRVTDPFVRDLSWSPDGSRIAMSYLGNIWTMEVLSGALRSWTAISTFARFPTWSPDGVFILFGIRIGSSGGLYTIDTRDGTQVRVLHGGIIATSGSAARFSPDGQRIVLSWPAVASQLYVMNRDGSDYHAITQLGGTALNPQWSPDGRTIWFDFTPTPCQPEGSLRRKTWTVSSDGSNALEWSANLGDPMAQFGFPFVLSPDGRKAAYVGVDASGIDAEIWTTNVNGSARRQISWR